MNTKMRHYSKKKLLDVAQNFYGFGNWNAKYVLVGLELGGKPKDFDGLYEFLSKKKKNGKLPELIDFIKYHDKVNPAWWKNNKTQKTYSPILKALPPFKEIEKVTSGEMKSENFGITKNGKYLAIELSVLPCKGADIKDFWKYKKKLGVNKELYHNKYVYPRIHTIAKKLTRRKFEEFERTIILYGFSSEINILMCELMLRGAKPKEQNRKSVPDKDHVKVFKWGETKIIHFYHPRARNIRRYLDKLQNLLKAST